ncbi:hypothetical protein HGRIS_006856 [Hohenbuehelia grisea]|uniref:G-alpha-domain-containing protein n=1 Tax=Hohenbuehelia grisea TaxID=104357 RepID=A0ABR3JBD6_9AGAR
MPRSLDEDPLTLALAPPPNESATDRTAREAAEAEAKRISDEIDEQIRKEREGRKRKKRPVKVLLLGQSESGKTATLKNFQLTYSKREFAAERAGWRAVIQLNLVRNVNAVLDVLAAEIAGPGARGGSGQAKGKKSVVIAGVSDDDDDDDEEDEVEEDTQAREDSRENEARERPMQTRRGSASAGPSSPRMASALKGGSKHVSTPSGSLALPVAMPIASGSGSVSSTAALQIPLPMPSMSMTMSASTSPPSASASRPRKRSKPSPSTSASASASASASSTSASKTPTGSSPGKALKFTEAHRVLRLRLSPLGRVQRELERRLGAGSMEPDSTSVTSAAPFESAWAPQWSVHGNGRPNGSLGTGTGTGAGAGGGGEAGGRRALQEFSVNSNNGWKSALEKLKSGVPGMARGRRGSDSSGGSNGRTKKDIDEEVTEVIAGCREDMRTLWEDRVVREMLARRKVRIEDAPGFFLNDADRIATRTYEPTDDDVIRARLRTLGVQEYRFVFDSGRTVGQTWHMFDVGGTRSSRAAWYPYFDDVDAIIFLAPISCFDEKLAEDRRVNRLEDSYLLWRSVCQSKLLVRTQLILFLNKCDLLQAKLMRGVRIRDHVPSFGDRRNDLGTATRYFQQHFKEISKQFSPAPRPFYVHLTSVIDTKSTAATLGAVEESILRDHLRRADLIV